MQILIEFHLQNLDPASTRNLNQTSASPLNLKFKILTQPSFRTSTKIQLHHLYKTSAAKCSTSSSFKILLNFNFKILTNPCAQSLRDQTSAPKSVTNCCQHDVVKYKTQNTKRKQNTKHKMQNTE